MAQSKYIELAVDGVKGLSPYQPGKPIDELARELNLDPQSIIKLASNENPMGPSAKAIEAIKAELSDLSRYPDGNGFELKSTLSSKLSIDTNQITLGNGSSDILEFVVKCFVNPGDDVIFSQHAFAIYGLVSKMVGANCIQVPALNWGHDLEAMAAAITNKTKVVFVTNPNNPTGTWNTKKELASFLSKVSSNVIVLLDEAYFEYVSDAEYPNGLEFLSQHPNLVVTRTFSKVYGLASLRVGYGVSSPELADILNRVRPPFNVDSFALAAAVATLQDDEYVNNSIALNNAGMKQLENGFKKLKIQWIRSAGNFISFEVPRAFEVNVALLRKGIIVRPIANYEMPNHLRVTIGTESENSRFMQALTEILEGL